MKFLSILPNTLTFLNLFFGCIAVVCGLNGDLKSLALFVFLGMLCDFFDGFTARLLNIKSKIGAQLDSFSDLVTFGFSSSVVMFILLSNSSFIIDSSPDSYIKLIPYLSFLITISSSYRLANFNLESNDSYFIGLPTPANALLIVFLPFLFENRIIIEYVQIQDSTSFLLIIVILSSYLLVCKIKMFSLKIKKFNNRTKKFLFVFILSFLPMYMILKFAVFPIIILIYIFINLLRIKV
jgi:CDP-diacylglycerol--serine O-phosphatidyltransferase